MSNTLDDLRPGTLVHYVDTNSTGTQIHRPAIVVHLLDTVGTCHLYVFGTKVNPGRGVIANPFLVTSVSVSHTEVVNTWHWIDDCPIDFWISTP